MTEFQFALKFALPDPSSNPDEYLDALFEAGCDDALVGVGQHGSIGLDFTREAKNAMSAVRSAIRNVKKAIPNAELIEVSPDLVGLADIASILGCTRQNVRKLASSPKSRFPSPAHTGGHASLWHLVDVLGWAAEREQVLVVSNPPILYEVSLASAATNTSIQFARYKKFQSKPKIIKALKSHAIKKRKSAAKVKQANIAASA